VNAHLALTKDIVRNDPSAAKMSPLFEAVVSKGEKKRELFAKTIEEYAKAWESIPNWYKHRFEQHYSVPDWLSATSFRVRTTTSLIIGNGEMSVLESHLTLHRIYGVPYIPGTALKGIAAHYCNTYLGEREEFLAGNEFYNILFGSQERKGFIGFHDALPTPERVAELFVQDVMTPHHQGYNQIVRGQANPEFAPAPRDDDSPEPIPFLAVRGEFQVLLTCDNNGQEGRDWLAIAEAILTQALKQEGIGGKTNAGYGLMERIDSEELLNGE